MGLAKRLRAVVSENYKDVVDAVTPNQIVGSKSNIHYAVTCHSLPTAETVYQELKLHLLDVNNWHRYLPGLTAKFSLTDSVGRVTQRQASAGNHLKIDIPGPKLRLGGGFDWASIRTIEEKSVNQIELFYMVAVPSPNPTCENQEAAHFLGTSASTTFFAVKEGPTVRILIKSRNEVPNHTVPGLHDQLRNRIVGFLAGVYLSHFQWSKLAQALLQVSIKGGQMADRSFVNN